MRLFDHFLWCSCKDNLTAGSAAIRSDINQPVSPLHYIQIMFNYDYGISPVYQTGYSINYSTIFILNQ